MRERFEQLMDQACHLPCLTPWLSHKLHLRQTCFDCQLSTSFGRSLIKLEQYRED